MKRIFFSLFTFFFALCLCLGQEAKVGEVLPAWQEGELDIHFISTYHGECTYQIFPDGTTFLVDASGALSKWKKLGPVSPGQMVVRYINHFSPEVSKGHINYFMLTHHHGDHMGSLVKEVPVPWHSSNLFKLTSLCEIGAELIMDNIFDRDYPAFNFPKENTGEMMINYQDFLKWTKRKHKSKIAKWAVGSSKQVVPLHDKSCGVTVRNLAGNGCVATGVEGESVQYMPTKQVFDVMEKKAFPDENALSCAYMLSYGKFDFFLGGDLQVISNKTDNIDEVPYTFWDAETPLLPVIHKVEVMKANHHGYQGSHSTNFINKLAPDIWLVGVWGGDNHPNYGPMGRVIKANPNVQIFCTRQGNKNFGSLVEHIGLDEVDHYIVGRRGHIVVRVAPGGDSYMIYVLDDSDYEYKVASIHGPYVCSDPE